MILIKIKRINALFLGVPGIAARTGCGLYTVPYEEFENDYPSCGTFLGQLLVENLIPVD